MPRPSRTWQAALPAVLGLLLLLVSGWLFSTVPDRQAEERAYAAATACPAGGGDTRADDCTTSVPASVERKEREDARGADKDWLHLVVSGSDTARRVRMDHADGPVYRSVEPGDRVTVTYWRGEIRAVSAGDLREATHAAPRGGWRMPLGIALALLPVAVMLLWLGWWARYRLRRGTPPSRYMWVVAGAWGAAVLWAVWALFASTLGSGVPGVLLAAAYGAPGAVAVSGLSVWLGARRLRAADETGDIVAVAPGGRQVVAASVRGDVPYAVAGYTFLVVGDGRPAATADPAGRFARKELPETLSVEGVRGFRMSQDPEDWFTTYKWTGVAIECRDGEKTVLVATRRRDAPVVLGALRADVTPAAG
ncbi:hypothetical protein AB0G32_30795 [Streptomyces sp. NPDC023723]|uniref:hypothetical protein n=1 Tax=Streptomyces sp. NPDC023723 TaxID=3154323 RepID=UPI0033DBC6E2